GRARSARQRAARVRRRPGAGPPDSSHRPLLGRRVRRPRRRTDPAWNRRAATGAIQHMLDLRPGLAAYARASYDLEQQGRLGAAAALMRRALGDAVDPADIAFCRYQLGELAWRAGRLHDAETEYTDGHAADPAYLPVLAGQARVAAARGHDAAALAG